MIRGFIAIYVSMLALTSALLLGMHLAFASTASQSDLFDWGARHDEASNSAALTAVFSSLTSSTVVVPRGTWKLACGVYYRAHAAVRLIGEDEHQSILQFAPGCRFNGTDLFEWNGVSGGSVQNLTIDLNTPATPSASYAAVSARAYERNLAGFTVQHVHVINGVAADTGATNVALINLAAAGGHSLTGALISDNYLAYSVASTAGNYCIAETTVSSAGSISGTQILRNTCVYSGIQVDGDDQFVSENDVSGWKFGAGIYGADSTAIAASCRNIQFIKNRLHDTMPGVDINNTAHLGMELHCPYSIVDSNYAFNLGGPGIVTSGDYTTLTNNVTHDNGKNGSGGAGGIGDQAGIFVEVLPGNALSTGAGVVIGQGNISFDGGTGTQKYGIAFGNSLSAAHPVELTAGSSYSGAAQAIVIGTPKSVRID